MMHQVHESPAARREDSPIALLATLAAALWVGHAASAQVCTHPIGDVAFGMVGDVNGNQVINVADVTCVNLAALAVQLNPGSPDWPGCLVGPPVTADVNCSGVVNVGDVQLTVGLVLGLGLPEAIDQDQDGCADACSSSPLTPPSAPGHVVITPSHTGLSVSFSPPSSDGGSPVLLYSLSCTGPGGPFLTTGPGSPLSLADLQPDSTYICTVAAINLQGEGPGSSPQQAELPSCSDGVQNGDEEGADCGGAHCPGCNLCISPASAGPDQNLLPAQTTTSLNAAPLAQGETGQWTLIEGQGSFDEAGSPASQVSGLGPGLNIFRWTLTAGPCAGTWDEVAVIRPIVCEGNPSVTTAADILNLRVCRVITGNLVVNNISGLSNFAPLVNLEEIQGNFSVTTNLGLTSFSGLVKLEIVGGDLNIQSNTQLTTLGGLESLFSVGGQLRIVSNGLLSNLNGLSGLEQVGTAPDHGILVRGNGWLADASGLGQLHTVAGHFWFAHNPSLTTIDVGSLASVSGDFKVEGNVMLSSVVAPQLTGVGRDFIVAQNAALGQCHVLDLEDQVMPNVGGARLIRDNLDESGCDWVQAPSPNCTRDFLIWSKAERDRLALCTQVVGSVTFHTNNAPLAFRPGSMLGMENLESVSGNFAINSSPDLVTLDGLDGLQTIGGTLSFNSCANLEDVSALGALTSVGGSLNVQACARMTLPSGQFAGLITIGGNLLWQNNINAIAYTAEIDAFPALESVGGFLSVEGSNLVSLKGFGSLTAIGTQTPVGAQLNIAFNSRLAEIDAFANLQTVPGNFRILNNNLLVQVSAFPSLTSVGQAFAISNNPLLPTIDGFSSLVTNGTTLRIQNNGALQSIAGFGALQVVGTSGTHDLSITSNANLTAITAFGTLKETKGDFLVTDNSQLTSLGGFAALERVGRHLRFERNNQLASLGLNALGTTPGSGVSISFTISENPTLPQCLAYDLRDQIINGPGNIGAGGVTIFMNQSDAGCPNVVPPVSNCLSNHSISTAAGALALANCTETGGISITSTTLTNLDGLQNISKINGSLSIQNCPNLASLELLSSLEETTQHLIISSCASLQTVELPELKFVGGFVLLQNNAALINIDGLGALESVAEHLRISNCGALTSIAGLSSLASLGPAPTHYLEITQCAQLASLQGLEGLTEVAGYLNLNQLGAITSLAGLDGIEQIGGDFTITSCGALQTLAGLDALQHVGGKVEIFTNSQLQSLQGLGSLQSIGAHLNIWQNNSLQSLTGLNALTQVGDYLWIRNNFLLQDVAALSSLTSVGGYLHVSNNGNLQSLAGLSTLSTVGDYLRVEANNLLTTLGLTSLTSVDGDFIIFNNPVLPECLATQLSVQPGLTIAGITTIGSNDANATCP